MQIQDALEAIRRFHDKMGAPIGARPTLLPGDRAEAARLATAIAELAKLVREKGLPLADLLLLRAAMALEELAEWLDAHVREDLVAAADAWADRMYVLIGDAVVACLPASEIFAEVHHSNMTKEPDSAGRGKAVKGPGYQKPELEPILLTGKDQSRLSYKHQFVNVSAVISFEPDALRAHFEDAAEMAARMAVVTNQQLLDAAVNYLANADQVWEHFDEWCRAIAESAIGPPNDCESGP
jgi:predicted HAD superfamily Cof-like phosphohydrolase